RAVWSYVRSRTRLGLHSNPPRARGDGLAARGVAPPLAAGRPLTPVAHPDLPGGTVTFLGPSRRQAVRGMRPVVAHYDGAVGGADVADDDLGGGPHAPALRIPSGAADVTAAWLTATLRAGGVLPRGAVRSVRAAPLGHGFVGEVVRFSLDYDGD